MMSRFLLRVCKNAFVTSLQNITSTSLLWSWFMSFIHVGMVDASIRNVLSMTLGSFPFTECLRADLWHALTRRAPWRFLASSSEDVFTESTHFSACSWISVGTSSSSIWVTASFNRKSISPRLDSSKDFLSAAESTVESSMILVMVRKMVSESISHASKANIVRN